MKRIEIVLIAIVAFVCSCTLQADNKYKIVGTGWDKYNGKEFRVIVKDTSNTGLKILEKLTIEKGQFVFDGQITHPQTAFLGIYNSDGSFAGWKQNFIIENGNIHLDLKEGYKKSTITGGKYYDIILNEVPNRELVKIAEKELKIMSDDFYALSKEEQNGEAQEILMNAYKKTVKAKKDAYLDLYSNHSDPYVRLLCLSHIKGMKNLSEEFVKLETELGKVPEIEVMKYSIKEAEDKAKNRKTIEVGSIAADFTAKSLDRELINLMNIVKKNKFVLVEFWASWCSPCRAEIPHMKEAYSHFKDKDFEIVSFSLDHLQGSWEKASNKEQIPWVNLADLKAKKSPVVQMYGVQGIPANFLVNQDGKIVSMNLRGKALDKKLAELLN